MPHFSKTNEMSDDHRVWSSGRADWARLRSRAAGLGPSAQKMMADYQSHVCSGPPWGTAVKPKPELSDYV